MERILLLSMRIVLKSNKFQEKYNNNYYTDEIMSVRDKKTLLWHLIYFKAENTQKIYDKILDKKGED